LGVCAYLTSNRKKYMYPHMANNTEMWDKAVVLNIDIRERAE
jgi:hypothetical protein